MWEWINHRESCNRLIIRDLIITFCSRIPGLSDPLSHWLRVWSVFFVSFVIVYQSTDTFSDTYRLIIHQMNQTFSRNIALFTRQEYPSAYSYLTALSTSCFFLSHTLLLQLPTSTSVAVLSPRHPRRAGPGWSSCVRARPGYIYMSSPGRRGWCTRPRSDTASRPDRRRWPHSAGRYLTDAERASVHAWIGGRW